MDGCKGAGKDWSNGVVTVNGVQGGVSDGANLRDQELVSDGYNDEGSGEFPPLGGSEDRRYVISASRRWGMGAIIGGRGLGRGGAVTIE